jgi:hypothetical protein
LGSGEAVCGRAADDADKTEALVDGSAVIARRADETVDEQGFDIGLKLMEYRVALDDGIPILEVERRFHGSAGAGILRNHPSGSTVMDEDQQNDDAGHDTWGALGVRAVSQALAQSHVLGIAGMIEHSLGLKSAAAPTMGNPPDVNPEANK